MKERRSSAMDPKENSQYFTPLPTQKKCQGVIRWSFHPCLWPLKAPVLHAPQWS